LEGSVTSSERSDWGMIDDTFACVNNGDSIIDFILPSLGRIGLNKIPPVRTYNLPPHYGLGVKNYLKSIIKFPLTLNLNSKISIYLTGYGNLETNEWIKVLIDGQENFQLKNDYSFIPYGYKCTGLTTYPYQSEYYSETHIANTVTISFSTNVDQNVSD
jgi:hypothetical protein